jgi:YidC/Oxa1 family membrane protein insertase
MEERRLLLAVALSLAVVIGYTWLFAPAPPQQTPAPPATAQPASPAAASVQPSGAATVGPKPVEAEREVSQAAPVALATVADERERRVDVTARDYAVAFTNRGARLISWTLNRYRDVRGRPEEVVPAQSTTIRPLDVETGDVRVDALLREALFVASATSLEVAAGEPQSLRFRFAEGTLEAEKTIVFRAHGLAAVTVSVKHEGRSLPCRLIWGPGLGTSTPEEREVRGYTEPTAVILQAGKVEQFRAGKLPPEGRRLEAVRWAGVESIYFAALFVPPDDKGTVEIRKVTLPQPGEDKPIVAALVAIDASSSAPVELFVGAKEHADLLKLGHGLDRVVQVGDWIGPIVLALMGALRWVHSHVGNWGWSIVLVTIAINLAMAPFRHYSIANGLKMAKISPETRAIQERYRKIPLMDPRRQQMQEEMSALYARHGMSQTSMLTVGCLPMLLTMPFLWAFYRLLTVLVDLRGAPWLWIPDLAQKDPLFITPVLMGVSMFAMQKMTPSAMDPTQQRVMMLMPLMFAGMFLWAPAGLNLYWFTSNLWSLLQQWVEMKVLRPADVKAVRDRKSR